jgi:hypothetical protein
VCRLPGTRFLQNHSHLNFTTVQDQLLDLGKLSSYRFQVIDILIASGSSNSVTPSVQLDKQFNKIIGIGYFEKTDGGLGSDYNVGAKTQRQVWIDPVIINAWAADNNVGPMSKYYKVNIPYASGDNFYAIVDPGAATSSDLTGQMVLILAKDLTEMPRQ